MTFERYLERRFGLMTSHGISPQAIEKFEAGDQVSAAGALKDPKRLAAVRAMGLLDTLPTNLYLVRILTKIILLS